MTTHTTLAARSSSLFSEHLGKAPPDVIYHYTDANGLLDIFKTSTLWATNIYYLNDSTEFQGTLDIMKARLKKEFNSTDMSVDINTLPNRKQIAIKLSAFLSGKLRPPSVFVICFSAARDLLSQWRAYAGSYGYSIGFRTETLKRLGEEGEDVYGKCIQTEFVLGKCIYETDKKIAIIDQIVDHYVKYSEYINVVSEIGNVLLECGAFFKDCAFKDEHEWRWVANPLSSYNITKYRRGKSMIVPYISKSIGTGVNSSLDHVYVGPCPHMELSVSSLTMMLLQKRLSEGVDCSVGCGGSVDVRRSAIPFRDW